MKENYYSETYRRDVDDLFQRLRTTWSRESCSPSLRDQWTPQSASGQCFVTAAAVQDIFGGTIKEIHFKDGSVHFFNQLNTGIVDLTASQFGGRVKPEIYTDSVPTDRTACMRDPIKRARYEALRKALDEKQV